MTRAPASFGRWLGAIALLLMVGVLWWRFNAPPGRTGAPFPNDFLDYYVPQTERASARLRDAELPLWDPHTCSGTPLLATLQVAALYPPTWLAALRPPEQALPLRMGLETALAALLAAALFLAWGLARPAALAGGLLFAFACVLGNAFWPPQLSTLVWLPGLLLCVEKLMGRWSWRWWAALAACAALQWLAGFPQYLLYSYYLLGPYALVRLLALHRRGWAALAARAAGLAAALALGAGLAGAQLLPTLELVGESARAAPLSAERIQHGFFIEPLSLAGMARNALDPRPKLIIPGYGYRYGYLGTPTLVLLAIGLVAGFARERRGRTAVLLATAALALLLSEGFRGPTAPLYELYARLPTGGTFRDPQRFRVLALFCLICLAVPGLDAVARGFSGLRLRRGVFAAAAAAAVASTAAIAAAGRWPAGGLALATLALAAAAARFAERRRVPQACALAILVLLAMDLVHATRPAAGSFRSVPTGWLTTLHADAYAVLDAARFEELRAAAGHARLAFPALEPVLGLPPLGGAYRVSCMDPLAPDAWVRLNAELTGQSDQRPLLAGLSPAALASIYDVTGVHTVARLERDPAPRDRGGREDRDLWLLALQEGGPSPFAPPYLHLHLERNADALPRAYVAEHYEIRGADETRASVARGDYDFRSSVLLERAPGFAAAAPTPIRPAEIVGYAPERVEIEVEARQPSLLVLTDSFYPGWHASVDGAGAEVLRANGLFRAVELAPGRHRVVFSYEPASLRRGAALSLASLALLGGVPLAARLRAGARSASGAA